MTLATLKARAPDPESTIHVLVQLLTFKFLDETKQTVIILTNHVFYFVATERLVHDIEFRHVSTV